MNTKSLLTCILGDRKGLGHGVREPIYHIPKSAQGNYPYADKDIYADDSDIEIEDESFEAIDKKVHIPSVVDPQPTDTLYFVGASTKLHACFSRYNSVLDKIFKTGKEISLLEISIGGTDSSKAFDVGSFKRTGTKRGWASPPPMSNPEAQEDESEDWFYNLEDLSDDQRRSLGEYFTFGRYI